MLNSEKIAVSQLSEKLEEKCTSTIMSNQKLQSCGYMLLCYGRYLANIFLQNFSLDLIAYIYLLVKFLFCRFCCFSCLFATSYGE